MMRKYKNAKGITLVALVVTIIVLLILAGVTIAMTISGDSLFGRARNSTDAYNQAQHEEQEALAGYSSYYDNMVNAYADYNSTGGNGLVNYTITYNLDGGSISGQKTTYTKEDTFTLPTPTRTDYTFMGWTGSNGTTKQKTVTIPKGTTGNLTYTANWAITRLEILRTNRFCTWICYVF